MFFKEPAEVSFFLSGHFSQFRFLSENHLASTNQVW